MKRRIILKILKDYVKFNIRVWAVSPGYYMQQVKNVLNKDAQGLLDTYDKVFRDICVPWGDELERDINTLLGK